MLFTQPTLASEAVRNAAAPVALAQAPGLGTLFTSQDGALGTARLPVKNTDVRTASGWLSARRPLAFMAVRKKSLGTELLSQFQTMVRAASGWLSARPSGNFSQTQDSALGTARGLVKSTDVRTASGWLSARRPVTFMNLRGVLPGKGFSPRMGSMVRAASGVLSARPSRFSNDKQDAWLGTARQPVDTPGARIASGWLSVRAPDHFSEMAAEQAGGYHLPVFPVEVAEWMQPGQGKWIIDGTLGGGGHSEIFLEAGATVLGVDRDPEALAHARARLGVFGERFSTWEGNFSQLGEIPAIQNGKKADGLLLDLGVSSRQLDSAARGFSFMREGPLDMRMGPSSPRTAADVVNEWSEADLTRILFEFGEEPKARRIAAAIVKQRDARPFETTTQLAACIEATVGRHGRTHPATRAFQAIRMAVNEELESLASALDMVSSVLKPGGRLLVITFHSLEDRMVKRFLRHRSTQFIDDPAWPEPRPNPDFEFQLLARKAIIPTAGEISLNPRARSAKLRVAMLLEPAS
jgi:16S rRNA (cytosine1402-N4)-methyltransferase